MTSLRPRAVLGEIAGGLLLLAIGVVWAIGAGDYGLLGEGGRLAPGTVPFFCGAALALTGTFIAGKALLHSGRRADDIGDSGGAEITVAGAGNPAPATAGTTITATRPSIATRLRLIPVTYPVLSVYLIMAAGILLMPVFGFAVSFALLIFVILRFVERQRVLTSILVGVTTAACGFLLFEVLFNLPLPEPFFL